MAARSSAWPLLIGLFSFAALEVTILNNAMSLVGVATALPFRAGTVPFAALAENWLIVSNLLGGSLFGAWFGAGWATRLKSAALYKSISGDLHHNQMRGDDARRERLYSRWKLAKQDVGRSGAA